MHDDAAAAEVERAAQLERERVLLEAADAKARDLAEAKYLNVLQVCCVVVRISFGSEAAVSRTSGICSRSRMLMS